MRGGCEDHLLDHRWVDPRHVLVLWDIRKGLRSLTWGEVTGAAKGTAVPQLQGGQQLRRLDTAHCEEVVERLTEKVRWVVGMACLRPWPKKRAWGVGTVGTDPSRGISRT